MEVRMRAWLLFLACPGCFLGGGDPPPTARPDATSGGEPTVVVAATDGGEGGPGGTLSIRTTSMPSIEGLLGAFGGDGGKAGLGHLGPSGEEGKRGADGTVEVLEDAGWFFDRAAVPAESLISVGVAGQSDLLPESSGPTIAVDRLDIGPDATLALSRYPLVTVRELHVAAGGRLVLRDLGHAAIAADDADAFDEEGVAGGTVMIVAERLLVEGTLDARGNPGARAEPGGFGGQLLVRCEELFVGADGAILVDGGPGGAGLDEE
jgi:hypothetical protein